MKHSAYYIGLMSGTSADAVDVVAVDFAENNTHLLASHSVPLPANLRHNIYALASPSHNEIDQLGELDQQLGELFAATINVLIAEHGLNAANCVAIGSHGQTIRHRPPLTSPHPFTLQVGDPNLIAQRTGITTIADFRRRDMAAGGHGAPLVPAFHQALFHSKDKDRVIVNIGGMANITWLPAKGDVSGFDTGPGNVLMDAWVLKCLNKTYDANGAWAATGQPHPELLAALLRHPFFQQLPPKSTGREAFNLNWLELTQKTLQTTVSNADIQATLLALTAISISNCIKRMTDKEVDVFVCGGGAYNARLMDELQQQLPNSKVASTARLGIAPEWVEAMAFAWLAKQTMNRQTGNLPAVTGAREGVILGGVYFAC
jgi:anhydro-N-acetylmuramic acid kinase